MQLAETVDDRRERITPTSDHRERELELKETAIPSKKILSSVVNFSVLFSESVNPVSYQWIAFQSILGKAARIDLRCSGKISTLQSGQKRFLTLRVDPIGKRTNSM